MINIFSVISIVLLLAAAFTKLFDLFVKEETKNELREKVEKVWVDLDDKSPVIIMQAPLIFLSSFYNILFGKRCFSKLAFTRSAVLSVGFLIVSLSITGAFTGEPFGMKNLPWGYFDNMIKSEKVIYEASLNNPAEENEEKDLESIEYSKKRWEYVSNFNNTKWRIIYTAFFILFVFVINAIIDTISFSISRLMLNEMIQTKSVLLMLSVLLINTLFSFFIATIVLFSSILITVPSIATTAVTFVVSLLFHHPSWTSIGLFAAAVGAWNLSGGWLKVLPLTTIFPSLIFCFAIFISILINPFKKRVYKIIKITILKVLEHDKGVFSFFTLFFATIGTIVGGIVKLFSS